MAPPILFLDAEKVADVSVIGDGKGVIGFSFEWGFWSRIHPAARELSIRLEKVTRRQNDSPCWMEPSARLKMDL